MKLRRGTSVGSVVLLAVLASGCGARPDVAVEVNGSTWSMDQLDGVVGVICHPQTAAQVIQGEISRGSVRSQVAVMKATRTLTEDFLASQGMEDSSGGARIRGTAQSALTMVPAADRDEVADLLTASPQFTAALVEVGAAEAHDGKAAPQDPAQQGPLLTSGTAVFNRWVAEQDVAFDPRLALDGTSMRVDPTQTGQAQLTFGAADVGSVAVSDLSATAGQDTTSLAPQHLCSGTE